MSKRQLRIVYDPDFAPLTYRNEQGEAAGRIITRLSNALSHADIDCQFVPVAMSCHEAMIAEGGCDAIAALARTPERSRHFDFAPPFTTTGGSFFARRPFDAKHQPAGTVVATPAAGPLAALILSRFPQLDVAAVTDYETALNAVVDGKAAAAALNRDVGRLICEHRFTGCFDLPDRIEFPVSIGMALLKGRHPDMIAALNRPG